MIEIEENSVQKTFHDDATIPDTNIPVDHGFYTTPRQTLTNFRFIVNMVAGGIVGWVINWVIALVATSNTDRTTMWSSVKSFDSPTDGYIRMYGAPIYIDWFFSGLLTAFIGGIIGHFTIRFEVSRAKKRPIHSSYTQGKIFTAFGANTKHMLLRALIYMAWGVAVTYPILIILMASLCSLGALQSMLTPPDFVHETCYLNRMWFCLAKGFYCVVVTTVIAPLIEVGALAEHNLTKGTLQRYKNRKAVEHSAQQAFGDDDNNQYLTNTSPNSSSVSMGSSSTHQHGDVAIAMAENQS